MVGFFVLNMFVGVVVENFHRCHEEQEKERTEKQLNNPVVLNVETRKSEGIKRFYPLIDCVFLLRILNSCK